MELFWKIAQWVSEKLKLTGAICLVGMALLTCVDVVGRFFKHPIYGSVELVTFMGVLAVAMALPLTHETKGHIGVELFVRKLSKKARAAIDTITGTVSLVFFVLVTWRMFDYGVKMKISGEVSMNLQLPEYMIIFIVGICFVVFSLSILKGIIESLRIMREK